MILLAALFSMSCTRIYFVHVERPVEIPQGAWQLPSDVQTPGWEIQFHDRRPMGAFITPITGPIYLGSDTIKSEYLQKFNLLDIKKNENN